MNSEYEDLIPVALTVGSPTTKFKAEEGFRSRESGEDILFVYSTLTDDLSFFPSRFVPPINYIGP